MRLTGRALLKILPRFLSAFVFISVSVCLSVCLSVSLSPPPPPPLEPMRLTGCSNPEIPSSRPYSTTPSLAHYFSRQSFISIFQPPPPPPTSPIPPPHPSLSATNPRAVFYLLSFVLILTLYSPCSGQVSPALLARGALRLNGQSLTFLTAERSALTVKRCRLRRTTAEV